MNGHQRLGIIVLLSMVTLTVTGAAALTSTVAQQGPATASNATIVVGATGTATAQPDLAVVDVAVEASADSATGARTAVAENVSRLRTALADAGVSDDQVRTTAYSVRSERDENGSVTYLAVHAFELRVPVDDAGGVVDAAVSGGATRVDGVQFTLTDATRRDLRTEALEEALTTARADADTLASATGREVRTVQRVETVDGGGPVFAASARADGTTFDPGPVTVTASVSVTYAAQ